MGDSLIRPLREGEAVKPTWVRYVHSRIRKNKNFICLISGPTGSGKSWTALSIAMQLDPTFGPERITFGLKGLMNLINQGEGNLRPGSVFIWDEFQQEGNSRSWQSLTNRLLNSLLSTFRHKRFVLLITSPFSDFIDSNARKLLHSEFLITGINYDNKTARVQPQLLQYNSRKQKTYYKYLRVKGRFGYVPLRWWDVEAPPKWIIDVYEKQKTEFTKNLNKSIEKQIDEAERKTIDTRKHLTTKQEEVLEVLAQTEGNVQKAVPLLGISERAIYFHIEAAEKKGWKWQEFKAGVENAD